MSAEEKKAPKAVADEELNQVAGGEGRVEIQRRYHCHDCGKTYLKFDQYIWPTCAYCKSIRISIEIVEQPDAFRIEPPSA